LEITAVVTGIFGYSVILSPPTTETLVYSIVLCDNVTSPTLNDWCVECNVNVVNIPPLFTGLPIGLG